MKSMRFGLGLAAFAAALVVSGAARADGLVAKPSQLPEATRASLQSDIAAYKTQRPELFDAVKNVKGYHPETYKQFRNPVPGVSRELRAFGKDALLPMLNELAFEAPAKDGASDREWTALEVGLLDAVGVIRDARSAPVLHVAFEASAGAPDVAAAAARALGRLGGDAELALLLKHTAANDPLRLAAIEGLGECKRVEAAKELASIFSATNDETTAKIAARALGAVGSSWAWKAMGPAAEATGLEVREIAARALVPRYRGAPDAVRHRIRTAILMLEHPIVPQLLAAERAQAADTQVEHELATVQQQVERQLATH